MWFHSLGYYVFLQLKTHAADRPAILRFFLTDEAPLLDGLVALPIIACNRLNEEWIRLGLSSLRCSCLDSWRNCGRWVPSSVPQSILYDTDTGGSSRDLRGSNLSFGHYNSLDSDRQIRHVEPAYSFVGMHCIFDHCKASATIVKFGHMSSNLLAYGASDGSLTICNASEQPSLCHQLKGHSKAITGGLDLALQFNEGDKHETNREGGPCLFVWK
ncbi:uncharacterized protein LOC141848301 [Curcuma longa]|uniref:uncharacterized protein LOC141848301 n=1 Tax=Curcuma longa TaxID=136217 RepID=UPI003D9DBA53